MAQHGSAGTAAGRQAEQGTRAAADNAAAAIAADASRRLDAVARAHAACASLLHLLTDQNGADAWASQCLPEALDCLWSLAGSLWTHPACPGECVGGWHLVDLDLLNQLHA